MLGKSIKGKMEDAEESKSAITSLRNLSELDSLAKLKNDKDLDHKIDKIINQLFI